MACLHKCLHDLQLQYATWEVKTLFIGTFNPEWNVCENNYSKWFYGRVQRNEFWCILPKVYQERSLINGNRDVWIDFCRNYHLAITDIIESIDANIDDPDHCRKICKFKDSDLIQFGVIINNIPAILDSNPLIKQICITRQTLPTFWENCFRDTIQYVQKNPGRNIQIKYLRSPSRGARRGVSGNFCEFVANKWISKQHYSINL